MCLDVINQTWSPMFDMLNIFDVFLPQLLRYPNPSDPLNGEAAALLMRHPTEYEAKVRGTCFVVLRSAIADGKQSTSRDMRHRMHLHPKPRMMVEVKTRMKR